jgi:hypothetical protein
MYAAIEKSSPSGPPPVGTPQADHRPKSADKREAVACGVAQASGVTSDKDANDHADNGSP